jgi:ethanolamine utilization protein EutQ (cupin superfamily)
MLKHILKPTRIESAGNKPKTIDEFIGRINSDTSKISIARMKSPPGWIEPAQTPEFDEYTFVLSGSVHVAADNQNYVVKAGELFMAPKGTKIQYSTPDSDGAEYIAICLPAFSPETVNREG